MITRSTVERFLTACSRPRPYRFLDSLVQDGDTAPRCRKHGIEKARHSYGSELWVCPECFPAEVSA